MENGRGSPAATQALNELYATALLALPPGNGRAASSAVKSCINSILSCKRAGRGCDGGGNRARHRLVVLFGGAVITVGFTFFFATENLRAQTVMTAAVSILIFSGLLTVIAIDHPLRRVGEGRTGSARGRARRLRRCGKALSDGAPLLRLQAALLHHFLGAEALLRDLLGEFFRRVDGGDLAPG